MFLGEKLKEKLSWRTVKHIRTTLSTILGESGILGLHRRQSGTQDQTSATWPSARKGDLDSGTAEFLAGKASGTVRFVGLAVDLDRLTDRRIASLALARRRFADWISSCESHVVRRAFRRTQDPF